MKATQLSVSTSELFSKCRSKLLTLLRLHAHKQRT